MVMSALVLSCDDEYIIYVYMVISPQIYERAKHCGLHRNHK